MSNKRAQDRLLIRLMGLQGQVYSDVEFGTGESMSESSKEEIEMTAEEAKSLLVDYGSYRKSPVTLEELKEKAPEDFQWLLKTYRVGPRSSEKMKKLHYGARVLAEI
jgi:DNA polymerase/3'-5' exonuclease PolX